MVNYITDTATSGADTLRGAAQKNYGGISVDPEPGSFVYNAIYNLIDTINGLDGDDTIIGDLYSADLNQRYGSDKLYGGNGNDTIYGDTGPEDPNRAVLTTGGSNQLYGGFGNDKLYAGNSVSGDYLYGESGNDTIYGGIGADWAYGGHGSDTIFGGAGNDRILGCESIGGADGADIIRAGEGDDSIYGGQGSDTIYGDNGGDSIDGDGIGSDDTVARDTLTYIDMAGRVHVDLAIEFQQNTEYGGLDTIRNIENLIGSNFNDRLQGSDEVGEVLNGAKGADLLRGRGGNDKLLGADGADRLEGGTGNDALNGGTGADLLYGEGGKDSLTGGGGADKFYFTNPLGSKNIDTISDFSHTDDTICLKKTVFAALGPTLTSDEFRLGSAAADSGDHIIYAKSSGKLYYDADGTGSKAATLFAIVDANTNLAVNDFLLV